MTRPVSGLGGVTVAVPSPADTATFLAEALHFHRTTDGHAERLTCGPDGQRPPSALLTLVPGSSLSVREVTLQAATAEALTELAQRAGATADDGAVTLHDPDGIPVVARLDADELPEPLPASPIRPRRLGHVNLTVTHAPAAARFWLDTVGLALSEQVGELLYFFRAGTLHHNLGIRGGARQPGVHHIALEVDGWPSYRDICDRLAGLGYTVEYGPGRHSPGNNLFVYLRDPHSGLRLELFCEMTHITDEDAFQPPVWDAADRPRTVNRWGPAPPESFLA